MSRRLRKLKLAQMAAEVAGLKAQVAYYETEIARHEGTLAGVVFMVKEAAYDRRGGRKLARYRFL